MNRLAFRVDNLSKRYLIGHRDSHSTLRDALANAAKWPFQTLQSFMNSDSQTRPAKDILWALKDVSFQVEWGEVVGIIGPNGSGKSTLLKILSRITEPTEGRVEGYGRVGSLLEVGTGFHPELTGRENVYLNGAILGMKKVEIDRKFDEIIAFAEMDKFLDTPVKRYSSGMYVRLAFSVAAHLEPDILIIDEVLAVGDTAFQKKCLGKIDHVAREGRTVLFVSHNMGMVQKLCHRAILLRSGSKVIDDTTDRTIGAYLRSLEEAVTEDLLERTQRSGKGQIRIVRIEISTGDYNSSAVLSTGSPARFVIHVSAVRLGMSCSFTIYDQFGQPVTYFDSALHSQDDQVRQENCAEFVCEIDELMLIPGRYRINAAIMWNGELQDHLEAAAFFEVEQGALRGRPVPREAGYGNIFMHHHWINPD